MARPTRPIGDLLGGNGGLPLTVCPECGKTGFYSSQARKHKGDNGTENEGALYRTRVCRFCGFARTERVKIEIEEV